jgi:arylsulfatase A-like enzyme
VTPAALSRRSLLSLGLLLGAALGAIAGVAEAVLSPLGEPLRIPFAIGVDGLLGVAWGLAVALFLLPIAAIRRRGAAPACGVLFAVVTFPAFAAALGLLANRGLLRGTHFLSPVSLVIDGVAVIVAVLLAVGAGRALRGCVGRMPGARPPGSGAALAAVLLLAAAAVLPGTRLERGRPGADVPPLVLVSIDTLRPDRLSGGGFPEGTSPEIDRLCAEGLLFTEAVAASPGSAASHAALLTARYPVSNGVWANFTILDESVTTLAEVLRERGYRTGGFVTNTFLGRRFGFDQGFDVYVESGVVERLEEPSRAALWRSLALVQIIDRIRGRYQIGYDPSFETALAWLAESDRPTFWFVHLMDVHSPYVPPHPYGPRFGADPSAGGDTTLKRNRFGWRPSEEAYLAEIRFADAKMGRLRRRLAELGRLDRSVLVLTTDHGENLKDHEPHYSHGATLYDATLRVLSAVRAPGRMPPHRMVGEVFENVDVLPTLFSLLDWDLPPEWEGRSFHPSPPARDGVTVSQLNRDFAVRARDWKILLLDTGERRHHRLDLDPGERTTHPLTAERIAEVETFWAAWMAETATPLYLEQARSIAPEDLSPEVVRKLRALGYVD